MKGALHAIHNVLSKIPFVKLRFCTHVESTNYDEIKKAKILWIHNYLGSEYLERTLFLNDSENDRTTLKGHFLIDDNPYVLDSLNINSKNRQWDLILFSQPYNTLHNNLSCIQNFSWSHVDMLRTLLISHYHRQFSSENSN